MAKLTDLPHREAGPHPPPPRTIVEVPAYQAAWHLWRAIDRDARLTLAEQDVQYQVLADHAGWSR